MLVVALCVAACIEVPPLNPRDAGFTEDGGSLDADAAIDSGADAAIDPCTDEDDDGYLPQGCQNTFARRLRRQALELQSRRTRRLRQRDERIISG